MWFSLGVALKLFGGYVEYIHTGSKIFGAVLKLCTRIVEQRVRNGPPHGKHQMKL